MASAPFFVWPMVRISDFDQTVPLMRPFRSWSAPGRGGGQSPAISLGWRAHGRGAEGRYADPPHQWTERGSVRGERLPDATVRTRSLRAGMSGRLAGLVRSLCLAPSSPRRGDPGRLCGPLRLAPFDAHVVRRSDRLATTATRGAIVYGERVGCAKRGRVRALPAGADRSRSLAVLRCRYR